MYMGFLEDPLRPGQVNSLRIVIDRGRTVRGKVIDAEGRGLPDMRVNVHFRGELSGLRSVSGSSATHTDENGVFEAISAGPGPYTISVKDRESRRGEVRGVREGAEDLEIRWRPPERKP
jgi:hypothetical protein